MSRDFVIDKRRSVQFLDVTIEYFEYDWKKKKKFIKSK